MAQQQRGVLARPGVQQRQPLLHGLGIQTGIELDKLIDAGAYISQVLGRKPASRVANAVLAKRVH